jgi:anti-sigma B factor antagonist
MSFETWRDGETAVIGVDRFLGVGTRQELKALVLDALERGDRHFRLDFSRTIYIDSSGLGVLVSLRKQVTARGGTLRIGGLNAELRTLFVATKLNGLFRIEDDGEGSAGRAARLPPPPPPPQRGADDTPRPDRAPEW